MTIKPILFGTPMVEAILEGRKTQTRRVCSNDEHLKFLTMRTINRIWDSRIEECPNPLRTEAVFKDPINFEIPIKCKFQKGDILWVREGFRYVHHYGFQDKFIQYRDESTNAHCPIPDPDQIIPDESGWKPSIHMPKAACRIFLEVTNVRVERLQDISEADAIAEGIEIIENEKYGRVFRHYQMGNQEHYFKVPELSFKSLWQSINGKDSWDANPWVWVYDFKRVEKPSNF